MEVICLAKKLNIYGPIVQEKLYTNDVTASDVKDFIEDLDANEELDVHINSYGGLVDSGLAIYQIIKAHKGTTTVYVDGAACSIASIIAFAGDELVMPESSLMMIHLPYVGTIGNKLDLQKEINALETMERSMMTIYSSNLRNKSDKQKIEDFLHEEKWLNADEVIEYFHATLVKDSENGQAAAGAGVLSRFIKNSNADKSEEYKQKVLQNMAVTKKRSAKNERVKVADAKKNIALRFKKGEK